MKNNKLLNSLKDKVSIVSNVYLENIPNYVTNTVVDGVSIVLDFQWNVRMKRRTIAIYNTLGDCYLRRTVLYEAEPLQLNSFAHNDGVISDIVLIKRDKGVSDLFNWKDNYFISFTKFLELE